MSGITVDWAAGNMPTAKKARERMAQVRTARLEEFRNNVVRAVQARIEDERNYHSFVAGPAVDGLTLSELHEITAPLAAAPFHYEVKLTPIGTSGRVQVTIRWAGLEEE